MEMAKETLTREGKFKRLVYIVGEPAPHVIGHLELLWHSGWASLDPFFRDSIDVEAAAEWDGEPGKLTKALVECRFLDPYGDGFVIHGFWNHAPWSVKQRATRAGIDWKSDAERSLDDRRTDAERSPDSVPPDQTRPDQTRDIHTSTSSTPDPDFLSDFADRWNETARAHGLTTIRKLTGSRKKAIRLRVKEHGRESLDEALSQVERSPFLQGVGGRESWRGASLDWLLTKRNFIKVIEGTYNERTRDPGQETTARTFDIEDVRKYETDRRWSDYCDYVLSLPPGEGERFKEWLKSDGRET